MAAALAAGQSHRLLRIDGTAIRIESGRDADACSEEGQQIYFERRKDVDYQRVNRRRGGGVAKAEDDKVRGFLVEKGAPGFKAWDVHGKWSLRASVTSGLSFSDCEIPEENLLPGVVGLKGPLSCWNQPRSGIGWGALAAAMACYDTALQYAKTRKQFANKPIASHQLG